MDRAEHLDWCFKGSFRITVGAVVFICFVRKSDISTKLIEFMRESYVGVYMCICVWVYMYL